MLFDEPPDAVLRKAVLGFVRTQDELPSGAGFDFKREVLKLWVAERLVPAEPPGVCWAP